MHHQHHMQDLFGRAEKFQRGMQLPIWTLLQHHNSVLHELPQRHSKLRCLCGKWHHHDLHDLQNWLLRLCGCLRGLQCQLQQLHGLGLLELQIYLYCFGNQLCLRRFCIDVPQYFSRHLRDLYEFCDQLSYLHCWNTRHLLDLQRWQLSQQLNCLHDLSHGLHSLQRCLNMHCLRFQLSSIRRRL